MEKQDNLKLRVMKQVDEKGRLLIPKNMRQILNSNAFYVELYDDGHIELKPIKGGK